MNIHDRIKALYGKTKPVQGQSKVIQPEPFKPSGTFKIKNLPKPLYPFQVEGVEFLHINNGCCILGDDMGVGKTAQILAYLHHNPTIRPAIIFCKANLKLKWAVETFMFMSRRAENTAYILSGRTKKSIQEVYLRGDGKLAFTEHDKLPGNGIIIANYDIMEDWAKEICSIIPKQIVLDEAHNMKSTGTKRYKAFKLIRKKTGCKKIIPTTGTLLENRPMDLYNAISMVAPTLFKNKLYFGKRYCDGKKTPFGWDFSGVSRTAELYTIMTKIMLRRKKSDVLKDLPPKTRIIIPLQIDMKEYRRVEQDPETKGTAKREKLLQAAARGKLEAFLDWVEEFLATGQKLVVFAYHRDVVEAIYQEFKEWAIKVDGTTKASDKQCAEDVFQNNKKVKLLVGNLKSAGEGLTLTAAYATATVELLDHTPSLHLQAEDRVLRIGQEADAVFAYYFMAIDTIDEESIAELQKRSKVAAEVLDGETTGDFTTKQEETWTTFTQIQLW